MNPDLPGAPAYSALRPPLHQPSPAEPEVAESICHALAMSGRVARLAGGSGLMGRFLFEPDGSAPLFVKCVPSARAEHMRTVDDLVDHLGDVAAGARRQTSVIHEDVAIHVYPFVSGRRANANEHDMQRLGKAIKSLHHDMRTLPMAAAIKDRAADWLEFLEEIAIRASEQRISGFSEAAAEQLAKRRRPLTAYIEESNAQVLHGDLNFGNVLIQPDEGAAALLDFENAIRTYGAPRQDLVFAIGRFCFLESGGPETDLSLARALLDGYGRDAADLRMTPEEISLILEHYNILALAVQAAVLDDGQPHSQSEVDKFLALLADIPRKVETLSGL